MKVEKIYKAFAYFKCNLQLYLEEKDDWLNELISDEAFYRTAPATPGLLINILVKNFHQFVFKELIAGQHYIADFYWFGP